ncbi:Na+/H+ antiporter NhaC [Flavobacteriaceae bacterium]|uniref:Na+/H+ antiporter NhaC n=1 Tax=Candidatus Arcticimaribacter forsetii TaxID=2820661 RepID=UPI0020776BDE|nr:Na+/H+ antiporter NhaC [Candidatus Arcticimaribacter forsetii]MDA8698969.1 Na+/H+ antiporter NhaC [Flavobacteriaceae bacterium]MDB2329385.1 Na+/H+ antiporter NhaC [Flavobacteriaceae bacterium]MDB2345591.1 Na+/H+ antiporter NhaC [Flavobacteriaceae bacterium]MDB4716779.1 Na+/H+ antiporter NhaC [Flavobacteriaceae bacterium]MDB4751947.1 Na+/H+ antiporter NhaC [Flavobacteriaceae bacterium]
MQQENQSSITLRGALIPVIILVLLLSFNVTIFGDDALGGSNQFILLIGAAVAAIVGFKNKITYESMLDAIGSNLKSTTGAILILLFVGALAGTWLLSGIIPAMIYYGLQILHPSIFLPACIIICAIISIATGSSWTTSATVGIALIGIGRALEIPVGMVAGAVISGAYFGDKLSPLSDTTNLAPAMAGSDLFTHIKYMTHTTIPSIVITMVVFLILGFFQNTSGAADTDVLLTSIKERFTINLGLFIVPILVIVLIIKKTPPLAALLAGTLLGGIFALIFQPDIVTKIAGSETLTISSGYQGVMNAITSDISITTNNELLNDLFSSGGMKGMLGTIWLIICAMVFGGIMDAIGGLKKLSNALLSVAESTFQLFASTAASCVVINLTASDQYLSIVLPGKMFNKAFEDKNLAPENLSRTLEDSGTVTSVLIPWNTCGAYQSGVLGVGVGEYFIYAIFNWLSPFMTLIYAYFGIKIKKITTVK